MSNFTHCKGKIACRYNGKRCLTCDQTLTEIEQTRSLIETLTDFAIAQGYENM